MTGKPITVLLADGDEGFLASVRALVEGQPELNVVGTATDGPETIALAARLEPDAAVISLHTPRLDGTAAIARLRQNHRSLCLIALTDDADDDLVQAARRAGADEVIRKREFVAMLLDRIQRPRAA